MTCQRRADFESMKRRRMEIDWIGGLMAALIWGPVIYLYILQPPYKSDEE